MTPITDSGTQPAPHYCRRAADAGHRTGCPDWPLCLFPLPPLPAGRVLTLTKPVPAALDFDDFDDEPEPDDDDDVPGIAIVLVSMLGIVAYVVIAVCALAILLPFLV